MYYDLLVKQYGRDAVHTNKAQFGEIIYRPVDRRQNFVKRAVGLPGNRLRIVNDGIAIAVFTYVIDAFERSRRVKANKLARENLLKEAV